MLQREASNQNGSAFLSALALGLVMAILFQSLMSRIQSQAQAGNHLRAMLDADAVKTTLQMIYSNPAVCRQGLLPPNITLSALTNPSLAKTLKLSIPNSTGGMVLTTGSTFNQMTIQTIAFTTPTQINPTETTFRSTLSMTLKGDLNALATRIQIPFYLSTDASNIVTNCFATDQLPSSNLSIEDMICQGFGSSTAIYGVQTHFCLASPADPLAANPSSGAPSGGAQ